MRYVLFLCCLIFVSCQPKDNQNNYKEEPNQECTEPKAKNPPPDQYCVQYPISHMIDNESIMRSAMTLDQGSKIHIVYSIRVKVDPEEYVLRYANNINSQWEVVIFELDIANFDNLNIVVDAAGNVHIIFSDCSFANDSLACNLKYLSNSSGVWRLETIKEELSSVQFDNLSIIVGQDFVVHLAYIAKKYNDDLFIGYAVQYSWKNITDSKWQIEIILEFYDEDKVNSYDDINIIASLLGLDSIGNLYIAVCEQKSKDLKLFRKSSSGIWMEEKIAGGICEGIGDLALDEHDNLYILYFGSTVTNEETLYLGSNENSVWQFYDINIDMPKELDWGPTKLKISGDKFYIFRGGIIGFGEEKCFPPGILAPKYGAGYIVLLIGENNIWERYYLPDLGAEPVFYNTSQFTVNNDNLIYLVHNGIGLIDTCPTGPEYSNCEGINLAKGLYYYTWSENDPENLCANIENIETCCGCADFSEKCVLDYNQWECNGECFERYTWVPSWQWPEEKFIKEKAQYEEVKPEIIP